MSAADAAAQQTTEADDAVPSAPTDEVPIDSPKDGAVTSETQLPEEPGDSEPAAHSDEDTDTVTPAAQHPSAPEAGPAANDEPRDRLTASGLSIDDEPKTSDAMQVHGPEVLQSNEESSAAAGTETVTPITTVASSTAPAILPSTSQEPTAGSPAAPETAISAAVRLINAALAPFLAPDPTAPAEPPLLWGLLAWVRKKFGEDVPTGTATVSPAQTLSIAPTAPVQPEAVAAAASGLPADLERTVLASGLDQPLDFRFLPDDAGILIAEKNGALKLYHDGHVETVVTLPTSTGGERGIGGIEVDSDFANNHYIYASYTTVNAAGTNVNRLSRLTLSEDLHSIETERVILEFSEPNPIHHGGTIRINPVDHMLYWSTGENNFAPNAQDLSNLHGKIIRIDPATLQAAAGNPFLNTPGARPEIYAYGLRNPFRFSFTPEGAMLVGDVGSSSWEELNVVIPGGNYGWPLAEGPCGGCSFANPIYTYPHTAAPALAGAITSVLYYTDDALGEQYQNRVFISDYTLGWIRMLTFDPAFTSLISVETFDDQAGAVLQLLEGPDGNIYQLDYFGELSVIAPSGGNRAPKAVITATPSDGYRDLVVHFSGTDSSDPEGSALTYAWDFGVGGDGDTATAASPTWTYTEDGAYLVTLTVTDAEGKSNQATRRIVVGSTAPTIDTMEVSSTKYNAGDTISFNATASDADEEQLDSDAYHWTVLLHHADHIHPFADDIVGTDGRITIPRDPHNVDTTWYEITLTVTDASGLSTSKSINVYPNLVELQFTSNNPDAVYTVDGVPHKGTYTETAVVGVERVIGAVSPQFVNGRKRVFGSWSDGSLPTHTIVTPATATTFTVTYDDYVAPKTPDLSSIPTQILRSQGEDFERLAEALSTSAGVLVTAVANLPAGIIDTIESLLTSPLGWPAIATDRLNEFVALTSRAAAPVINSVTDVIATETVRLVGAAAAFVSNIVPLTAAVLVAPTEIANILVDTAIVLVDTALIHTDSFQFFGALAFGQVSLNKELEEQRGLILNAFSNVVADVTAALAVPLPPPAESKPPVSGNPLSPLTQALERTLKITAQSVDSTRGILGFTADSQVQAVLTAARTLGVFAAAKPQGDLILDWIAFTFAQQARTADEGRQLVAQATEKTGEDLAGAAESPSG